MSALGRPLDPRYPTNLAIVIIAVMSALIAVMTDQNPIAMAGGVFLAWSIGREIDPDYPLSAFIGSGLVIVLIYSLEQQSALMFLFAFLIAARIVNRIVGLDVKPIETAGIVLVTSILIVVLQRPAFGILISAALLLDARLEPKNRLHLPAGLLLILITLIYAWFGHPQTYSIPADYIPAAIIISVLFIVTIINTQTPASLTDIQGVAVSVRRVQATMILALFAGWLGGMAAFPLWLAMLGTALYRAVLAVRQRSTS